MSEKDHRYFFGQNPEMPWKQEKRSWVKEIIQKIRRSITKSFSTNRVSAAQNVNGIQDTGMSAKNINSSSGTELTEK
jgi:hypothetical protein